MSRLVTRPESPLPWTREMSIPCSRAMLRTSGEERVRRSSSLVDDPADPLPAPSPDVTATWPLAASVAGRVAPDSAAGRAEACVPAPASAVGSLAAGPGAEADFWADPSACEDAAFAGAAAGCPSPAARMVATTVPTSTV